VTGRDRVIAALEHRQPRRVPFSWGFGPTPEMESQLSRDLAGRGLDWAALRTATEDVITVTPRYTGPRLPPGVDMWGVRRAAVSYGPGAYNEVVGRPLAGVTDPRVIDAYPWPTADRFDWVGFRGEVIAPDPGLTRARKLGLVASGRPLEEYTWMTGLEETLINLLENPEVVHAALTRICDFVCEMQRRAAESCADLVDLLFLADDLGGQTGLLMSRPTYRAVVQPHHRRLIHSAHALFPRARAMYHTDGAVFDIIPDLLDAGVDVLEAVQVDAAGMDAGRLKAAYGERLAFQGAIAVQSLLPRADAASVAAECRRLVAVLGSGGGYIAAPSHAIQVGTPTANVLAMLAAVLGDDDYGWALEGARLPRSARR
jgi:uroporphyrinogen decarboxylase